LAGYIVERLSGQPYLAYLRRAIFRRAGIHSARAFAGACGSTRPYVRSRGVFKQVTFRQRVTAAPDPAMGVCMTVRDYARFDAALVPGKLLSAASFDELFGPQPGRGVWNYGWLRADPDATPMPGAPRTRKAYFAVGGHGWSPGYYTVVERFPTEQVSVMMFTNTGANARVFPYANRVANLALAAYR
jgi:CubicO group peptidase (beta-lactamase class C family)